MPSSCSLYSPFNYLNDSSVYLMKTFNVNNSFDDIKKLAYYLHTILYNRSLFLGCFYLRL